MNVVFVGVDDEYVVKLAHAVAELLDFAHVDFDLSLKKVLQRTIHTKLQNFESELCEKEQQEIQRILSVDKQVVSICNNSFLSNRNYELFEKELIICVEKKEENKLLKNIQKLIKKHSKICLKQEKIDLNQLKNNIFHKIK